MIRFEDLLEKVRAYSPDTAQALVDVRARTARHRRVRRTVSTRIALVAVATSATLWSRRA